MGQKVNPKGFRLGIYDNWSSRWYVGPNSQQWLKEDQAIRKFVRDRLRAAGIASVIVERAAGRAKVHIATAKPGLIIGKKGKDVDDLRKDLRALLSNEVSINIREVRKPDLESSLVAEQIAQSLERRVSPKRAMKEMINRVERSGAEGVKIQVAGRLNGAEIARTEKAKAGRVPLHTLRAEIDYGTAEAQTTYGIIGIKVWIFKGERFEEGEEQPIETVQL